MNPNKKNHSQSKSNYNIQANGFPNTASSNTNNSSYIKVLKQSNNNLGVNNNSSQPKSNRSNSSLHITSPPMLKNAVDKRLGIQNTQKSLVGLNFHQTAPVEHILSAVNNSSSCHFTKRGLNNLQRDSTEPSSKENSGLGKEALKRDSMVNGSGFNNFGSPGDNCQIEQNKENIKINNIIVNNSNRSISPLSISNSSHSKGNNNSSYSGGPGIGKILEKGILQNFVPKSGISNPGGLSHSLSNGSNIKVSPIKFFSSKNQQYPLIQYNQQSTTARDSLVSQSNVSTNISYLGSGETPDPPQSNTKSIEMNINRESLIIKKNAFCEKHPSKKAKYYSQKEESNPFHFIYFCSKCSIELALQGRRVFEIREDQEKLPISEGHYSSEADMKRVPEPHNVIEQSNEDKSDLNVRNTKSEEQEHVSVIPSLEIAPTQHQQFHFSSQHQQYLISTVDEEVRRAELDSFLSKLSSTLQENQESKSSLSSRRNDLKFFYDKQILKIDQMFKALLEIIEKEKNSTTAKLKELMNETDSSFLKMENKLEHSIKDMENIQRDIHQNMVNILKNMDIKPYKSILKKYESKREQYENLHSRLFIDKLYLQKLTNSSKLQYMQKIECELKPHIVSLFSSYQADTHFLKKDFAVESESPMQNEKLDLEKNNNSIYISFENKEMFENAIKHNIDTYECRSPQTYIIKDLAVLNNKKNKTPRQGDKLLVRNVKSPQQEGTTISSANTDLPNGKKYLNLLEKINNNQSNNSQFYSKVLEDMFVSPPWDKIGGGKDNCFVSPQMEKTMQNENSGMQNNKVIQSADPKLIFQAEGEKYLQGITSPGYKQVGSSNQNALGNPTPMNHQKEIKNYENFFVFIENKLNNELHSGPEGHVNNNYQKTLFCSPHFKDIEQPQETF